MQKISMTSALDNRAEKLLALVWPEGISVRDRVVLDAIPKEQRGRVLDRLEAVWRAELGEPLGPLAEFVGLKRAGFFNLRRSWSKERSLAALVPHETKSPRRISAPFDDPLRALAAQWLKEGPGRRNVDIAKLLLDHEESLKCETPQSALAALQRMERLVQHTRRDLASDPVFLRRAYGGGIVLDLTAVSLVLDEEVRTLAVAALLIETASGLIIGSALGRQCQASALQRDALESGITFLNSRRADLPLARAPAPDVGLMLATEADPGGIERALKPHVRELVIGRIGGFSFGQQAVQIVGPRVGRLVMNPRRTLKVDVDDFLITRTAQLVSLKQAEATWVREVQRHNAGRLDALTEAGIIGGSGHSHGRIATVLQAILEVMLADQTLSCA